MVRILQKQKLLHKLFEASVIIKAINGAWETVTGTAILLIGRVTVAHAFYDLTKHELSTGTRDFAALYILSHGLINLFLAYYLYKQKLWAFFVSIVFFASSIVYLTYQVNRNHSPILWGLILFDAVCVYLTIHEYNYRKAYKSAMAVIL